MAETMTPNAPTRNGAQANAARGGYTDPFRAYNFKLEIANLTEAHFTECSGMGIEVEAIAYRAGGTAQVVHRLPGQVRYADITLRYGLTQSQQLWQWFMTAVRGAVEPKNVSIVMLDSSGVRELTRWNLVNAWPAKWHGALLNAMSQEVAIESLTLVFETLDRS